MEGKAGDIAVRPADPLPVVANTNLASDRAGCVFDDWDLVPPADFDDGGHVARQADLMHAEYRPRLGRYRGLYEFRSDIESLRIDIDE
jgi:hypothetical protein